MWTVFNSKSATPAAQQTTARGIATPVAREMLTIWARQIENAREQTEVAVVELASRFGGIVEKLDSTIADSQQASALQASEAAQDGQQAEIHLSKVINALREIKHSRDMLTTEITAIVAYTGELQKMAEEVKMIAFQTNMLSLNAAIEAAHAGEKGKGFAVVAHEVSILSKASRDTGQNIHQRITSINEALHKISEHNKSATDHDQEAIQRSEQEIRTVLERQRQRVDQFSAVAGTVRTENTTIKNDIEDALIQLQFQDRVSQILTQITQLMTQSDAGTAPAISPDNVINLEKIQLDRMTSSYTTDEQRRIHAGLAAKAAAPREVTFF